jgi:Ca2+-binding RTX toxin-like protein
MRRARTGAAIAAVGVAVLAIAAPSNAGGGCFGEAPTIVHGAGDDRVQGTQGSDVIVTGGGDDFRRRWRR